MTDFMALLMFINVRTTFIYILQILCTSSRLANLQKGAH